MIAIIDREYQRPLMNCMDLLEDVKINKHVLSTGIQGYCFNFFLLSSLFIVFEVWVIEMCMHLCMN